VFGTIDNPPRKAHSAVEQELSLKLQTAWTEFAKDPAGGLLRLGWPLYEESSELVVDCPTMRLIRSQSRPLSASGARDLPRSPSNLGQNMTLALSWSRFIV
jgi:hypothetical protein